VAGRQFYPLGHGGIPPTPPFRHALAPNGEFFGGGIEEKMES